MKTVYFDLETGGVEPSRPIIQIAAAVYEDGRELETYECKVRFNEADCVPEALELNGYDPAVWARDAKPEKYALAGFCNLLSRHADIARISKRTGRPYLVARVGGHNVVSFDFPRVLDATRKHGLFLPTDFPPLDTLQLAAWYFSERYNRPADLQLGTLCEWFGIPQDQAHEALSDVRSCAALVPCLLHSTVSPSPGSEGA